MKKTLIITMVLLLGIAVHAQKFITRNGTVTFYSSTAVEDIKAVNNQVVSIISMTDGQVAISMLMKAFTFEKALMQEHFNEKYLHTDKYPKATFKGTIDNFSGLKLSTAAQKVSITGIMSIHGVDKKMTINGLIKQKEDGEIVGTSDLEIALKDFDIKVPSVVSGNIADTIQVKCNFEYEKMD